MTPFRSFEDITKEKSRKRVLVLALVCSLLAVAVLAYGKINRPFKVSPVPELAREIVSARSLAQYERALQLAASTPRDAAIETLSDEFQRKLSPDIRLHCVKSGVPLTAAPAPDACRELNSADRFYFKVSLVNAGHPCYLYIFLVDSAGGWTVLMPNKAYVPNQNPLLPAFYRVPDDIHGKLRTPDSPGAEKVFVVAAWWRIDALEDLAFALAAEPDSQRASALGARLLARLQLELGKPDGIKGLSVGTFDFHNAGGLPVQGIRKQ